MFEASLISSKSVDLEDIESCEQKNKFVEGEDRLHMIIGIPFPFKLFPEIDQAVGRAMKKVPNCVALSNCSI